MKTLIISNSKITQDLITKYLVFSNVSENNIFTADNKDDIELLMAAYDFHLILAEGFANYLNENNIERLDIINRNNKSSMSKLKGSYITKPIQITDIRNIVKAVIREHRKMAS